MMKVITMLDHCNKSRGLQFTMNYYARPLQQVQGAVINNDEANYYARLLQQAQGDVIHNGIDDECTMVITSGPKY